MLCVLLIAFVAIGGELHEPGTDILFGNIVPLGIGLQAQVDTHLRVLRLLARRQLQRLSHTCTGTLALIVGDRSCQSYLRVQFFIESFDLTGFEKRISPYAAIRLNATLT